MSNLLENELDLAWLCRDTVDSVRYEISLAMACWGRHGRRKNGSVHEENALKFITQAESLLARIKKGLNEP